MKINNNHTWKQKINKWVVGGSGWVVVKLYL